MTAAAHLPEPHGCSAADSDVGELEPSPEWAGDVIAATKFGSPEAIRVTLITEQVAEFDAALIAARQTLHLDQLRHVLRMWRRQALMTERDPEGHHQMLASIAEVQRTGRPRSGSLPWSELKAAQSVSQPLVRRTATDTSCVFRGFQRRGRKSQGSACRGRGPW